MWIHTVRGKNRDAAEVDPIFQEKQLKFGVQKNKQGHNFQNIGSKMNQRWVIDYDPTLIRFGSYILKIATMVIFLNTAFKFFFWKIG